MLVLTKGPCIPCIQDDLFIPRNIVDNATSVRAECSSQPASAPGCSPQKSTLCSPAFFNSMICKIHWQMNNRRILAHIRCIFNDKITQHDDAKHDSYLKTPKVKKLIFPKWRLLTGLDMDDLSTVILKTWIMTLSLRTTSWHGIEKTLSSTNGLTRSKNFTIIPNIQLLGILTGQQNRG